MMSAPVRLRNLTLRKVGVFKVAMGEGSGREESRVRLDAEGVPDDGRYTVSRAPGTAPAPSGIPVQLEDVLLPAPPKSPREQKSKLTRSFNI